MSLDELLASCAAKDITLALDDGQLRFRAPGGAMTTELRAQLQARRGELVAYLAAREQESFPLSPGQLALWTLHTLNPASSAYNLLLVLQAPATTDEAVLRQALAILLRRHPQLTMRLQPGPDGQPLQCYSQAAPDFQRLDAGASASQLLQIEARRPFRLGQEAPCRFRLYCTAAGQPLLAIIVHHIVADFRSLEVLRLHIIELYTQVAAGKTVTRCVFPSWRSHVEAQQGWIDSKAGREAMDYWLAQLDQLPPPLQLPGEQAAATSAGQLIRQLQPECFARLRSAATQLRVTPFVLALAAYMLFLHRWSGQQDVIVGCPMQGRNRPDSEQLVGYLTNPVALRSRIQDSTTLIQLIEALQRTVQAALRHQDLPFPQLAGRLTMPRSTQHSPVFQTLFTWNSQLPSLASPLEDWREQEQSGQEGGAYGLTLTYFDSNDQPRLVWSHDAGRFAPEQVQQFADCYQHILSTLLEPAALQRPLGTIALLPPQAPARPAPCSEAVCLHDLILRQAQEFPLRPALLFHGSHVSYGALERQASCMAAGLRAWGAGHETLVALNLPRGPQLIVAMLAVMQAGAVCLPLDVEHPLPRREAILRAAAPALLVTHDEDLGAQCPATTRCIRVEQLLPYEEDAVTASVLPQQLAYVIYTSGSTGTPKGVAVTHAGAANMVRQQIIAFGLHGNSRVLQFASPAFDASISEIFSTLGAGGLLVLDHESHASDRVLERVQAQAITVLTLPPALLAQLDWRPLPELETLVCAGEACPAALIERWSQGRTFINAYGPTETSVCASMAIYRDAVNAPVRIGHALPHLRIHILDAGLNPVPAGVAGELYIAGVGLARGYLHAPGLTADAFVPDPFSDNGGRLYRSGDRGRRCPDGQIEYLGRTDTQLKLRGHRIEPAEIEAALLQFPGVQAAHARVEDMSDGGKRLVAWVGCHDTLSLRELRNSLAMRLPAYMLPAAIGVAPDLPLTANGKIDQKALDTRLLQPVQDSYEAPCGALESLLCTLWSELLAVSEVSASANFFELGGNSLLAMRMAHQLQEKYGLCCHLADVFTTPTPRQLAALLQQQHTQARVFAPGDRAIADDETVLLI